MYHKFSYYNISEHNRKETEPKKRKHEKIDLTKHKVQYFVDIPLQTVQPSEELIKKAPELVKVDYETMPYNNRNPSIGMNNSFWIKARGRHGFNMSDYLSNQIRSEMVYGKNIKVNKAGKFGSFDEEEYNIGNENYDELGFEEDM